MVAVVSGTGLGLGTSSLSILGGRGAVGNASQGRGGEQVYVNSATGNLIIQDRDEYLSGVGAGLALIRTYNSQGQLTDDNGDNWRLGVQERLHTLTGTVNTAGSTITKVFGDGAEVSYLYDAAQGRYVSAEGAGANDTLSYDATSQQWTWTEGSSRQTEVYDNDGRLLSSSDSDGNTILYGYTGDLLTQVTDASGQVTYLDYNGNNLTQIRVVSDGQTETLTRYSYDDQNRLTQVTVDLSPEDNSVSDGRTYVTTYTYDGSSVRVASVTQSDGSTISFTYELIGGLYHVKTYTDGEGRITTLNYTNGGGSGSASANNAVLSNTETVTETVTLPPYYLVQVGDTWSSIAQTLYGDVRAASLLQQTLGNPSLVAGAHLVGFPATLSIPGAVQTGYVLHNGAGSSVPVVTSTFDANGRLIESTLADGSSITYQYDSAGNLIERRHGSVVESFVSNVQDSHTGLSGAAGSWFNYSINVPAGTTELRVTTRGGPGDADLYVRYGATPNYNQWDYRPYTGSANEDVVVSNPAAGTWYFSVNGYTSYSNLTVTAVASGTPQLAGQSYTVQSGDTWSSIAQALYGGSEIADELQRALGNPTLTAGAVLANLPQVVVNDRVEPMESHLDDTALNSTTTGEQQVSVTVPSYYVVASGDTWASIALAVYGTSDALAVAALQNSLGNPELTVGAHLTMAQTLSWGSGMSLSSPLGLVTTVFNDGQGQLISIESQAVGGAMLKTNYEYDADGNVTRITEDPNGANRGTVMEYDSNGNLTLTRDAAGNTVTRTYSSTNQLLTETYFAIPDSDGAGSGQPGDALTTRYVYDSEEHLRFVVSPEGRVTEQRYDASGNRVATLHYTAGLYDVSALTAATALSESQLTTWAGTQDLTQLERTDYAYDFRGNLSSATAYTATDTSGAGLASAASATHFVYDQRGQLIQSVDARGAVTSDPNDYVSTYTYDGLGRLLTTTQWVGSSETRTTINGYNDSTRTTTVTLANGLVTTSAFDRAGRLLTVTRSSGAQALGTTTYAYDADGRLRMITDPTGSRQYFLYDEAGRKTFAVDGDGTLTEYVYDHSSNLIETIQYSRGVNTALLTDGSGNPLATVDTLRLRASATGSQDRVVRAVYDSANRLVYSIDEEGGVTETRYDGASRVTQTIAYANRVTIPRTTAEVTIAAVQALLTSSTDDRHTRNFYDQDGNLLGTLDAAGYLSENVYDGAGRLTRTIGYATATPSAQRATGNLAALRPAADPDNDTVSYFFYDGEGRTVGVLDAEGYLTETAYDVAGDVSQVIRYDARRTYTAGATLASLRPASLGQSQVTSWEYDGSRRVTQETNYEGTITQYQYDSVGNLIAATRALDTSDARTTRTRYDALGRVIAELTAEGSAQITATMTPAQIDAVWAQYAVQYTYDLAGRRTSITDQNGNRSLFFYDQDGRVRYSVNALGEVTESVYNALNQVTTSIRYSNRISVSGLAGGTDLSAVSARVAAAADGSKDSVTTIAYTATGRVASTMTAEGGKVTHTYDAFGDEIARTEATDRTHSLQHQYAYDTRGQLIQTRWDPAGLNTSETREYDAFGRLVRLTDANGNVNQTTYDRLGRTIETRDALSNVRSTTYDAFSRTLTTTDALNNTTQYTYDDEARSIIVTTPEGISITTVHNRHGQTVSVRDGRGNTTHYVYDANGNLTTASDGLGALEARTYDHAGRQLTTSRGTVTSFTYDAANRILTRTVDSGAGGLALQTLYAYDGQGRVTSVTDPKLAVTTTEYDRDGHVAAVTVDPDGTARSRTEFTYDRAGHVITVTEGAGSSKPRVTQYGYDTLGRRTNEIVDPNGLHLQTAYEYDANGNVTLKSDPAGNETTYVYDADNLLRYTIDALGDVTETIYDAQGRVTSTRRYAEPITSNGETLTVENIPGHLTPSDSDRITQFVYDRDGREIYVIDAAGGVTEKSYDADGNVIRQRLYVNPIAAATYITTAEVTAALADAGNNTATVASDDRVQWTAYDSRNRAVFQVDGLGGVIQREYDGNGNVTTVTAFASFGPTGTSDLATLQSWADVNAGNTENRTTRTWYDGSNRAVFVLDAEGYLKETRYDDTGRATTEIVYAAKPTIPSGATTSDLESLGNGVVIPVNTARDQVTTTEYDAAGRVIRVTDAAGKFETYSYDAVGNKTTFTNKKGATWTYEYDANRRLTAEHSPEVSLTTTYLSYWSGYGGPYGEGDGNGSEGQMLSSSDVESITNTFEYDALGNVKTRTEALGRPEERTTRYEYDALGRQVRTILPQMTVYNYNGYGGQYGASRDESTIQPETDVTYDAFGNAVANSDVAGNVTFKVYDALGRVKYDVDAEGYVTEHQYDTFGNETALIRYADRLDANLGDFDQLSLQDVQDNLIVDPTMDRTIQTQYDRLNRAERVTQPAALNFEPASGVAGGQTFTAGATSVRQYDAFGQVVKESTLVNPLTNLWADTYAYYDHRGLETATVDAMGYLTTFEYDETGDLTRQVEYAKPLATASWNLEGHAAPTTTTPASSPGDPAGYDRESVFAYDQLNRKVSETRVGVEYTQVSGQSTTRTFGNQTTSFGYDAVGNQTRVTDASGASSYTYYDALGRQIATAAPTRDRGDGTLLTPLTEFHRDALGNLVEQISFGGGAASATETGFTAADDGDPDRVTRMQVDRYGHIMHTVDATGANRYASYNARGQVAKEWTAYVGSTPTLALALGGTEYPRATVYSYDRLGRRTDAREGTGVEAPPLDRRAEYNAFGEVVAQGVNGLQEYFDYDQAGRIWRTNSGDGVNKVYLYNLAGQKTAEIRSQTLDLSDFDDPQEVAALTTQRMRTEIRYDLLGQVVEQRLPSFVQANPDSELQLIGTQLHVDDNVAGPSNPDAVYRLVPSGDDFDNFSMLPELDPGATPADNGGYYFIPPTASNPAGGWAQDSSAHLVAGRYIHWAQPPDFVVSLASWSITAVFEYRPAGDSNAAWTQLQVVALPNGELGVNIGALSGNFDYRLTYTRANQLTPYALATGTVNTGSATPTLTDTTAATVTAEHLSPTSTAVQVSINSQIKDAQFRIGDVSGFGIDQFVYRRVVVGALVDYVVDRSATVDQGGGYYLTASGYVQKPDYQPSTSRYIYWNAPADNTLTATFEYRPTNDASAGWSSLDIASLASNRLGVAVGTLAAGQYEFRVSYNRSDDGQSVALGTGTFRIDETNTANHLDVAPDAADDVGHVAPISSRPAGSEDVTGEISDTSTVDHVSAGELYFTGTNDVFVKFPSIQGAVRVEIEYATVPYPPDDPTFPSVSRTVSIDLASGSSASAGTHVTWQDPAGMAGSGGIKQITNIRVYSLAQDGSATLTYATDLDSAHAIPSTSLSWKAPWESDVVATFNVRRAGTTAWQSLPITHVGSDFTVDTAAFGNGQWEYEVTYTQGSTLRAKATGTFVITGGGVANVAENPGTGPYPIEPVAPVSGTNTAPVELTIVSSAAQTVTGTPYDVTNGETHNNHPLPTAWSGNNQIDLTWADVGTGPVRVEVEYTSEPRYSYNYDNSSSFPHWSETAQFVPGQATSRTFDLSAAATGASLTWTDVADGQVGGVRSVDRVRVYTQDSSGQWVLRYDRDAAAPAGGKTLYWPSPDDSAISTSFQVRAHGSTSWQTLSVSTDAKGHQFVKLDSFADGDYDYRIVYSNGTQVTAIATGLVSIADSATAATSGSSIHLTQNNVTFDQGTNDFGTTPAGVQQISWTQAREAGDSVIVRSRLVGQTDWQTQTIDTAGPDFTATLTGAGGAPVEFEIQYIRQGESTPYARSGGTLNKTIAVATTAPRIDTTQSATTTTDLVPIEGVTSVGGYVSWLTSADPGATVQFRYQLSDGTWQELTASPVGTGFGVDQRILLPGTYRYEIRYTRSGQMQAYAYASGSMTIGRQTAGSGLSLVNTTTYVSTVIQQADPGIPTTHQTTDRWGDVLSVTDAANNTTNYQYNQLGQLIETLQPQMQVVDTSGGHVTTSTERPVTENDYDLLGRLIATRDGNGHLNSVSYNAAGEVISETHADGGGRGYVYDAFGNKVEIVDELGFRTRNTYDGDDRLIEVERELTLGALASGDSAAIVENSYEYNSAGQRTRETNGEGESIYYDYDLQGNLTQLQTQRGFSTYSSYDRQGKKVEETNAIGDSQTWDYDYFGRLTAHTDLGGVTYRFAYDEAGDLTRQTSSAGQNLAYEYDAAGHLTRIIDRGTPTDSSSGLTASNRLTDYGYDIAGRRIVERTTIDGRTQENTRIEYDALGRVKTLQDADYRVTYTYDGAGNRTSISASYYNHTGYLVSDLQTQNLWYTYDTMNRVLVSQGVNTNGSIGIDATQGIELGYDVKGQRTSARTYGEYIGISQTTDFLGNVTSTSYQKATGFYTERYGYDGLGSLLSTDEDASVTTYDPYAGENTSSTTSLRLDSRSYDKASRESTDQSWSLDGANSADTLTARGRTTTYDGDGRVSLQVTTKDGKTETRVVYGDATYVQDQYVAINKPGAGLLIGTSSGSGGSTAPLGASPPSQGGQVFVPAHWEGPGYDDAGVLRGYEVEVYRDGDYQYTTTYKLKYRSGDAYQQTEEDASSATTRSHVSVPQSGSTVRTYNVNGELVQTTDTRDASQNRYFANNAQGQALAVVQGNFDGKSGRLTASQAFDNALVRTGNQVKGQYFFFANGQMVGSFGQLQSGDGSFKANFDVNFSAISDSYPSSIPSQVIVQSGDTLRTIAARVFGDANLWYVIAQENGLTDPDAALEEGSQLRIPNDVIALSNNSSSFKPFDASQALGDTTPTQPAPPAHKGCGILGQILIVAVAIIATIYTAGAAASALGAVATTATGATATGAFSTGLAVLGSGTLTGGVLGATATGIAAGAIGGAVGSAISQGVANLADLQDGFDWNGVALGAIGGGVSAGLGGTPLAKIGGLRGAAENAAVSSALTQGIGVLTGVQHSFSWRDVAISTVAASVAYTADNYVEGIVPRSVAEFTGRVAAGITGSLVRGAFAGKIDTRSILADAFGNAIGNSIVDGIASTQTAPLSTQDLLSVRAEKEMSDATRRLLGGSSAALDGKGVPVDPWDLLRKNPDFQTALDKLGGDVSVLYDTSIWTLLSKAEAGTGANLRFDSDSGRVALERGEVSALSEALTLADPGVTSTSDDNPIAIAIRSGASVDEVSAKVSEHLGRFVTPDDISQLTAQLDVVDGRVTHSQFLSLKPLQTEVMWRGLLHIYTNPQYIERLTALDQAEARFTSFGADTPGDYRVQDSLYNDVQAKQNAVNNTVQRLSTELKEGGYIPARVLKSKEYGRYVDWMGTAMMMAVPVGPALEGAALAIARVTLAERLIGLASRGFLTSVERGSAASARELLGLARTEVALGVQLEKSSVLGVDAVIPNGPSIQLKGPFLKEDLSGVLTHDQQVAAIASVTRRASLNTAYDRLVVDTLGLSPQNYELLLGELAKLPKPPVVIR